MDIKRDYYLNSLINRMHNGMIKVITGIRRSGKSYLLFHIFRNYLLEQGIPESHIITMELDQRKNRKYRDPDVLLDYIDTLLVEDGSYYILLDEVQLLEEFEKVLNSLLHIQKADIYVTGSNSRFLSKDVISEFRGRGDEIHVYPLTFREFMSVYEGDMYHGWSEYVVYGGLPLTVAMGTEEQKRGYLTTLFEVTYLKDVVDRHHIEKIQELEVLINLLASAIGTVTNLSMIEATFKSRIQPSISQNTIRQYIEYLEDAFIISKASRYDVKGRRYIGTPLKYYFEDVGLRNARMGFWQVEEAHLMENITYNIKGRRYIGTPLKYYFVDVGLRNARMGFWQVEEAQLMENIIYNELRSRGYTVNVAVVEKRRVISAEGRTERIQLGVDFVANLGSRRYYVQSAFHMPTEEEWRQEKAALANVNDSFKKIIVVKDETAVTRDELGITTMSVYDFLLKENSLEL